VSSGRPSGLAWYGGVFGGLLPILLLGFIYSSVADRTVFALWALVAGACWVVVLRQGLVLDWRRVRLMAALAAVLAAGLAVFALLEWQHHEILDLGFRAVFPEIYHPIFTAPRTGLILAGASALIGAVFFIMSLRRETR
jgi:hypothetical protein